MNARESNVINAVAVSAGRKIEGGHGVQRAFSILLFSVFVVVDLLALVAGTNSYGAITSLQSQNDARIMTLGPIVSSVRANDVSQGVAFMDAGQAPEGRALVLVQADEFSDDTYETRIYLYQGKIVQEYALSTSAYTPEKATVLAESSTFDCSFDGAGLLTISTDAGTVHVALRNLQGGA